MDTKFSIPTILIASDRSSSGKTLISIGLMGALNKMGYHVQPFKVALDYIDPEYHSDVTKRNCRNLDGYLMKENDIKNVFVNACTEVINNNSADFSIIEGVRGLYEGLDPIQDIGSTSQISKILRVPIIFVINAKSITKSCAALIKGFSSFDDNINIKGIILNNIGNKTHELKAIKSIEYYTSIPVVGVIYRNETLKFEMESLGLRSIPYQYMNKELYLEKINKLINIIEKGVNINKIISIAKENKTELIINLEKNIFNKNECFDIEKKVVIGVPYDEAFNFYYEDNIKLIEKHNGIIEKFSILNDFSIPDNIDALYIGSGQIENYLDRLSNNKSMINSIINASKRELPIYGESSGMNYLTKSITRYYKDGTIKKYDMVGIIPGSTIIKENKQITVNYCNGIFIKNCIIGNEKDTFNAHEFHNTEIVDLPENTIFSINILRGNGIKNNYDGIIVNNTIGTYVHFHGVAYESWIKKFINAARIYKSKKDKL